MTNSSIIPNHPAKLRSNIALVITKIVQGQSLKQVQSDFLPRVEENSRAFAYEMIWGTIRHYHSLDNIANQLLNSPLQKKHHDVHALILLGIYQINFMRTPEYASVSETVNATKYLKKPWAKKLVNHCLRSFLRQQEKFSKTIEKHASLPNWLEQQISKDWPLEKALLFKNLKSQGMTSLRVNLNKISRDDYAKLLSEAEIAFSLSKFSPVCIHLLQSISIPKLPFFEQGYFSVQSESAQLAGDLAAFIISKIIQQSLSDGLLPDVITAESKHKQINILDACAAPGGKTSHLIELLQFLQNSQSAEIEDDLKFTVDLNPDTNPFESIHFEVDAVDIDSHRLKRLTENLTRLDLLSSPIHSHIYSFDLSDEHHPIWQNELNEKQYDLIVLDAPCSGTGVIRKNPDIKLHRTPEDILNLCQLQQSIMRNLWQKLTVGGYFIYLSCSILQKENQDQFDWCVENFQGGEFFDLCQFPRHIALGLGEGKYKQRLPLNNNFEEVKNSANSLHFGYNSFDGFYYMIFKKVI